MVATSVNRMFRMARTRTTEEATMIGLLLISILLICTGLMVQIPGPSQGYGKSIIASLVALFGWGWHFIICFQHPAEGVVLQSTALFLFAALTLISATVAFVSLSEWFLEEVW